MKYIKTYEKWATIADKYLINQDVKDEEQIKHFILMHNLSETILHIWKFGIENFNIYPDKITDTEILYILKDGCKIIIDLVGNEIGDIKKIKTEYIDGIFKKNTIDKDKFSFEKLKEMLL